MASEESEKEDKNTTKVICSTRVKDNPDGSDEMIVSVCGDETIKMTGKELEEKGTYAPTLLTQIDLNSTKISDLE